MGMYIWRIWGEVTGKLNSSGCKSARSPLHLLCLSLHVPPPFSSRQERKKKKKVGLPSLHPKYYHFFIPMAKTWSSFFFFFLRLGVTLPCHLSGMKFSDMPGVKSAHPSSERTGSTCEPPSSPPHLTFAPFAFRTFFFFLPPTLLFKLFNSFFSFAISLQSQPLLGWEGPLVLVVRNQ